MGVSPRLFTSVYIANNCGQSNLSSAPSGQAYCDFTWAKMPRNGNPCLDHHMMVGGS